MTSHSKIYKPFDVVIIPFPFSDQIQQKKRPALVLSSSEFNHTSNHIVTSMITTAKHSSWPLDTPIIHYEAAGLPHNCLIRMKFYTVDQSRVVRIAGRLEPEDMKNFKNNLQKLFKNT